VTTTIIGTTQRIEDNQKLKDDVILGIAIGISLIALMSILIAIIILRKKVRQRYVFTGIQLSSLCFNDNYYLLIFTFAEQY
jgi:hypothetical protein